MKMTREEEDGVRAAWAAGRGVQRRLRGREDEPWVLDRQPSWTWGVFEYRIAPPPRRFWIWATHVMTPNDGAVDLIARPPAAEYADRWVEVLEVVK